ncbi:MAG: DNA-3-methyladenine glycosylase 2 family protein [Lachnospiraceae bacterium]|nr:DNA-3-methyladenine glycosylase 2 family protein [Lachnospiraceae bacterium]
MTQIKINDDFDLDKIAGCGQCFRAKLFDEKRYRFVTENHVIYIEQTAEQEYSISCNMEEWEGIWNHYFDLERSYNSIYEEESGKHKFVQRAMNCGRGLRVLRQAPWEMLLTFIISQRKSIPAIAKSVEALAERFGQQVETEYETLYLFPTPDEMKDASPEELQECGLGYRVPYIMDAVRKVVSGELDLNEISQYSDEELMAELQKVHGVGKKVANCVCLFAYSRTACVPVDVWISRAIEEECGGNDPFTLFDRNAGIIQQYVFYYQKNRRQYGG